MAKQQEHGCDLVVVGGGAAGLAAAAFAARLAPEWRIRLLGGSQRLGAKLLLAGGGRCNLTHCSVSEHDYNGASARQTRPVLRAFPVERTRGFFREIGVALRDEGDGRVFPVSGRAREVRDALVRAASGQGVALEPAARVTEIGRDGRGFRLVTREGTVHLGARVVLATGGCSYAATGSDGSGYRLAEALGHSIVTPTPALVPLVLNGTWHRSLVGVSHMVELRLAAMGQKPLRLRGPLLWTHFGISGPAVLDVSRHWLRARAEGRATRLQLSFLPGEDSASVERRLIALAASAAGRTLVGALSEELPRSVVDAILGALRLSPSRAPSQLTRADRRRLAEALTEHVLDVRDSRGFDTAEVTAGGVALDEVDGSTLASRRSPGLFLAGELLDVDGRVGGFNLQWAWSSAWVAAQGAVRTSVM